MAVRELVLTCDYCTQEDDEHLSREEAQEAGWFVLFGPERELGGNGERAYCSKDCLVADL